MNRNLNGVGTNIIVGIFSILCIICLATPLQYANNAYAISTVFFVSAIIILKKETLEYKLENVLFWVAVILTVFLLLQLSVFQIFDKVIISCAPIRWLLMGGFLFLLSIAVWILVYRFLIVAMQEKKYDDNDELRIIPGIRLYLMVLPIAVITVAFVLSSYPSYAYPDIQSVWWQVTLNAWNEWHTIGFSLFVKIFSFGGRCQYAVLVFQGIFWIYICNFAVYVLYQIFHSRKICVIYTALATVFFTPALYCGAMVKDTIYCMCMFLFMLCMLYAVYAEKMMMWQVLLMIISGLGASVFRHAGWVAIACSLIIAELYFGIKKRKRLAIHLALFFVVLGTICINNVISKNVLHAEQNPSYIKYSVPMYMIGAVSNRINNISEEDLAVMEQIMPREKWNEIASANKYWVDSIAREYGAIGEDVLKLNNNDIGADIIKLNFKWLFKYPYQYITSALDISSILWEIGRPTDGYEWAPLEGGTIDFSLGDSGIVQTVAFSMTRCLANLSFQNPILNAIYWRGGIWSFAIIFSIAILVLKRLYKFLIVTSIPIINLLLLFLSIPSQDPRYILFLSECGLFILVFSFFINSESSSSDMMQNKSS